MKCKSTFSDTDSKVPVSVSGSMFNFDPLHVVCFGEQDVFKGKHFRFVVKAQLKYDDNDFLE